VLPLARAYGLDPYHFAIIFLLNLEIAYLMPPLGINLFISSIRFGRPITQLYRSVLTFIGVLFATLMVVSYVPAITTWLPSKVKGDDMAEGEDGAGAKPPEDNLDDKDFGLNAADLDKLTADGGVADAAAPDAAAPAAADAATPDAAAAAEGEAVPDHKGKHGKGSKGKSKPAKGKAKKTAE
jgi:hypothetical protein